MLLRTLAASLLLLGSATAVSAQTLYERVNECKRRVTVRLEIYSIPLNAGFEDANDREIVDPAPAADAAYAAEMKRQMEAVWNGITAQEAEVFGTLVNTSTRLDPRDRSTNTRRDPATGRPVDLDREDAQTALTNNQGNIRAHWARYANEFGATCAYIPCCEIEFVADVRTRAHDATPTPGYYQIGIMAGHYRSFVRFRRNPNIPDGEEFDPDNDDHWVAVGGYWAHRGTGSNSPVAHEAGHLMGLDDHYEAPDRNETPGHRHDVMDTNSAFPFESGLEEILRENGMMCDCCPEPSDTAISLYDNYLSDLAITTGAAGDAVAACNREQIQALITRLQNQRRDMALSNMVPRQKARLAAQIDYEIRRLQRALRECPPPANDRVTTGDLILRPLGMDLSWDSTQWCEYGDGQETPGTMTPIPGLPGIIFTPPGDGDDPSDVPGGGTPTGGTPTDGDDPRDTPTGGGTPTGGDEGDDPRDTPTGGDGGDPRDTPRPVPVPVPVSGGGDDGDDPRDTPTVTIYVKANESVIEGGGGQTSAVGGQSIRLIAPSVADPALPRQGERDDTDYSEDPMLCTTDDNGDCEINVDPYVMAQLTGQPLQDAQLASGYQMDIQTQDRESQTMTTREPLSDAQIQAIENLAVEGDEINVTGLDWSVDLGYRYRMDYGLKLGYDWGSAVDYDDIEDNVCRDKQPGPPLGWTPLEPVPGEDLPRQTIRLELE